MKQKILIAILAILLIGSIIFWNRKIASIKHENSIGKIERDSLDKKLSETEYNYGLALAKAHCITCHGFKFATDKYLEGVVQRRGEKYLSLYLTKQDSLVTAHDSLTVTIKGRLRKLWEQSQFQVFAK